MKKKLLALFVTFASSHAFASYLETCTFKAYVPSVTSMGVLNGHVTNDGKNIVAVLKVISAVNTGSHNADACASKVNTLQVVKLSERSQLEAGRTYDFSYYHLSGATSSDPYTYTRWLLIK